MEFRWFALEVVSVPRAVSFYRSVLDLEPVVADDTSATFRVGPHEFVLQTPERVPRGGVHTHYAFSATPSAYETWVERVSSTVPVTEVDFGGFRSLYFDDEDGHCVEIGGVDTESQDSSTATLTGVFEVVLEVSSLERATTRYEALGFSVIDTGTERRRVRLRGPIDLELWEPQLGLADARGGEHVSLAFAVAEPSALAGTVSMHFEDVHPTDSGVRLVDSDGHTVTLLAA